MIDGGHRSSSIHYKVTLSLPIYCPNLFCSILWLPLTHVLWLYVLAISPIFSMGRYGQLLYQFCAHITDAMLEDPRRYLERSYSQWLWLTSYVRPHNNISALTWLMPCLRTHNIICWDSPNLGNSWCAPMTVNMPKKPSTNFVLIWLAPYLRLYNDISWRLPYLGKC